MKYSLGVIGFGVMGQAIVTRALQDGALRPESVLVYDLDTSKIANCGNPVHAATSIEELLAKSERVFFAVKPQQYVDAVTGKDFSGVKTILTIMAGVSIETLRKNTGFSGGIVRVMPNTPCALGKGICAYCLDRTLPEEEEFTLHILSSCGDVVRIEEGQFDAVTSVSGSGPAYVYMFAQGLIQGGVNGGLTYEQAKKLALNTLCGAAELAKHSEESLDVLIDRVCSKGGTTIEAVKSFRNDGLTDVIAKGVEACRKRSEELGKGK